VRWGHRPGATVRVEQQRHEYRFGVAINHWLVVDGTNPTYNSRILQYFNHIALENGLKMVYWVPSPTIIITFNNFIIIFITIIMLMCN
jgi:hypothetical protein